MTPANDENIAGHIKRLVGLFLDQVAATKDLAWPARFVFPEPQDDAERRALSLFLDDLENETGGTNQVHHGTGPRLNFQTLTGQGLAAMGFKAHARYTPIPENQKGAVWALKSKTFSGKQTSLNGMTDGPPILALGAVGSATGLARKVCIVLLDGTHPHC